MGDTQPNIWKIILRCHIYSSETETIKWDRGFLFYLRYLQKNLQETNNRPIDKENVLNDKTNIPEEKN